MYYLKPVTFSKALALIILFLIPIKIIAQCLPSISHDSLQLVTDNTVYCSERKNDTIFIGGNFSYIGKYTGGLAPINPAGELIMPGHWPRVHGDVYAMVPDEHGGYYIGGHFTKIGDSNRANLAHIDASGTVTSFKIGMVYDDKGAKAAVVNCLMLKGNKLYIAGQFDFINNRTRRNTACIDVTTAKLTPWHANVSSYVNKMLMYKERIYIAGRIVGAGYDTTDVDNILAVDTVQGAHTGWHPTVNGEVKDMYMDADTLYICGKFSLIDGQSRAKAAAFDLNTGTMTPWNPQVAGSVATSVNTICVSGKDVLIGGNFTQINTVARRYAASLNKYTAVVNGWTPNPDDEVHCIRTNKNKTYVTGIFDTISSSARKCLAIYDATGNLTDTAAHANAVGPKGIFNLYFNNDDIYLMGDINSVGGKLRYGLAAYNANTIEILAFNPVISFKDNNYIRALKINNDLLYIGGAFAAINGKITTNAGVYNLAGDSVMSWSIGAMTGPFSEVRAIEIVGNKVYIGGVFSTVSGFAKRGIFVVDSATATIQNSTLSPSGSVYAIKNTGSALYIGGIFSSFNGQTRNNAAAVTLSENLLSWNPPSSLGSVFDISQVGGAIYIGANLKGIKVDSTTSKNPAPLLGWNALSLAGVVNKIIHYNGKIYAGGKLMGGNIDTAATATASSMNLEHDGSIYSLNNVDSSLYAFGSFGNINGLERHQSGIVRFDITSKQESSMAKLTSIQQPCGLQNSKQLWTVNTNLQNPTFSWYRNNTLIETSTIPHLQYTGLQTNAYVHCLVKAGTGCYTQQSVKTDMVKGLLIPATITAAMTGPTQVCNSVPSKFVATTNANATNCWWKYNDKYIDNNSKELIFTPAAPGRLYCWFSVPDSGCYVSDLRAAYLDINNVTGNIAPTHAITPNNVSHKCELDADTFKMTSNFHFGKRQWSINGVNVGLDSDTLIVQSMKKNDTVRCIITAAAPNCFSTQVTRDSIILVPQTNTVPLVSLSGIFSSGNFTVTANTNVSSVWKYLWYKNGVYLGLGVNTNVYSYIPGAGKETIVCKVVPYLGCYHPDTAVSNEIVITDGVSVNNVHTQENIFVYPNPFKGMLQISGLTEGDKIALYDAVSRKVAEGRKGTGTEKIYNFDLQQIPAGVYLLEIYDHAGIKKSVHKLNKY